MGLPAGGNASIPASTTLEPEKSALVIWAPLVIRLIECYERLEKRLLDESKQEFDTYQYLVPTQTVGINKTPAKDSLGCKPIKR